MARAFGSEYELQADAYTVGASLQSAASWAGAAQMWSLVFSRARRMLDPQWRIACPQPPPYPPLPTSHISRVRRPLT